jgi:TetR/AcrR family transcriptional regulator
LTLTIPIGIVSFMEAETIGNRERILECAALMFSERGYDAVPVAEIAETALVTKPTLYHYFGSKRGLLDELIQERGKPFLLAARAGAGKDSDVSVGLQLIATGLVAAARDDPVFARLRLSLSFAPPASEAARAAADFNAGLRSALEDWFRAAERHHGNMRGRSRFFAASFLGTLDAYVAMEISGEISLDDPRIREILRQYMHGIFS